jgi:plastocyanin
MARTWGGARSIESPQRWEHDVHRSTKAAFAAALCSLALPAASQAATKLVFAGAPLAKPPAGYPKDIDADQFFPRSIAVNVGDTLTFQFGGFHAAHFVKKGGTPPPFAIPDPAGTKTAGVKDAAGADFWFNGQPQFIFHPTLVAGLKSGTAFDGSKDVYSGAPMGNGKPKPWSVKLTKAGTYTFYCPIHPGMKATVKVLPKGKAVPSAKADTARVNAQLAKDLANLKKLDKKAPPAGNVIQAGQDLASGETLLRFVPSQKTVPAGTPVTLTMSARTAETHTFTFAKDAKTLTGLAKNFLAPLPGSGQAGPPTFGLASQALFPSDAPLTTYDGNNHGDGFLNTGALDADPKSPLPNSATVTFTTPGTYQYICLIHPEMKGTVVVQ